ncbi:hypothetical protein VTN31DRAFT_4612 [Thermomyces dupontii]|uniref:uncharacterized protein n=1 Tax=Talaromyces thermophilus TaxID=28565 RepID=UPI00374292F4
MNEKAWRDQKGCVTELRKESTVLGRYRRNLFSGYWAREAARFKQCIRKQRRGRRQHPQHPDPGPNQCHTAFKFIFFFYFIFLFFFFLIFLSSYRHWPFYGPVFYNPDDSRKNRLSDETDRGLCCSDGQSGESSSSFRIPCRKAYFYPPFN